MVKADNDIQAVLSGVAGFGKSTLAIRYAIEISNNLRNHFNLDVPKFSVREHVIYEPRRSDFNDILRKDRYNVMVVDEGYLAALNLESNKNGVIELVKILNATRSKNNAVIFCFQNIRRATKGLMERFNVWMHKPSKVTGILMARSNVFTTEDPWGLDRILKARTERQINFFLATNPNRMCYFKTKPLGPKRWKAYNDLKRQAHTSIATKNELRENMVTAHTAMMDKVYEVVEQRKAVSPVDLRPWLQKRLPNFTENQLKKFIADYSAYSVYRKEQELIKKGEWKGWKGDADTGDMDDTQA